MSVSVKRLEERAFYGCMSLVFIKLSQTLEYIGRVAFNDCGSLTSIFIPPSCQKIVRYAFWRCYKLLIFHVPQHTQLEKGVIVGTTLMKVSPFEHNFARDEEDMDNEMNDWIKNINNDDQYALHRACSSFDPSEDYIYGIVQRERSLAIFKRKNSIGITQLQYLAANPYAEVKEQKVINRFILEMTVEM